MGFVILPPEGLILHGGTILTIDPGRPQVDAVAVIGARIAAVGTFDEVRAAVPPTTETIDIGDRTLVPGFVDAHNHYFATAEAFAGVEVRDVRSIDELVRRIDHRAERTPPGRWIRGAGLEWSTYTEGRPPSREDLDAVSRQHPILVEHVSGHAVLVNSAALDLAGLRDDVRDPPGGSFDRDDRGRPTGIVRDTATGLVLGPSVDIGHHGPNFHVDVDPEEAIGYLRDAGPRYLAEGLTTIGDPQVTRRELTAYRDAHRLGLSGPRVTVLPLSSQLEEYEAIGLAGPIGDDRLRIAGMKFYTDGAITGGTAAFTDGLDADRSPGTFYHGPEVFGDLVGRAHRAGWQIAVHAMGDRAYDLYLDTLEAAFRERPPDDPRPRVEHGTYPTPAQQRRMASLGVIPVTQPGSIRELGDVWVSRLGDRVHEAMPLRSWLGLGLRPAISSDAFVQSYRPLDTISAACFRSTPSGLRIGPHHELTIEEAVRAHTLDAAHALFLDDRLGSIEPGKLADLAVVDGELLSTSPERIGELEVWLTILDGRIVHDRRQRASDSAHARPADR
jgi:predicted amidohydrolase YtcJ